MPKIEVPFAIQTGEGGATQNSQERLLNMFAEIVTSGRSQIIRRQRPGLGSVDAVTGEKRGIEKFNSIHYLVIGNTLYSFDGTTLTALGTLATVTGKVTMIFNDNSQLMVSDGERGYCWNGATLTVTSLPAGVRCGDLSYIGGFGIFNNVETATIYITGLNDFTTVDALDFATAESSPDPLRTTFVDHGQLILPGTVSTEIWDFTGASDFPFQPVTNAQMQRGCAAGKTYIGEDNTVFFLGDDLIVYKADGYRPVRISTHAVEEQIRRLSATAKAAAFAWTYTQRGHKVYVLTFGTALTLAHDIATGLWHEADTWGLAYWDVVGSRNSRADYVLTSAGICELQTGLSTDEGAIMRRGGISAPGWNGGEPVTVHSVQLDAEVGRAATGVSARVMLRIARDGETFGNERIRTLGATGDYRRKVMWRDCGQGRSPVAEFYITDPVELTVHSVLVDVS